jgi:hypothetical protein
MARPEVACVLRTHSIAGCAVSMQRDGLLPLNQHALQIIGGSAYHDYEGAGRSAEERARLLADLNDQHILVLRNHGLLIVGDRVIVGDRDDSDRGHTPVRGAYDQNPVGEKCVSSPVNVLNGVMGGGSAHRTTLAGWLIATHC